MTSIPKSTVVMPTCHRPEMLALALEKLQNAKHADNPNINVRIFLDMAPDSRLEEVSWIRDRYFPSAEIFRTRERPDVPSGCWNILHSLKQGYESEKEYIFIIEEDCLIYENYFPWHFEAQRSGEYFATCGRKLKHWRHNFYSNPGSCFHRDKLKLVIPHINDRFFQDTKGYMDRYFGPSGFGILDDGLIQRVQKASGLLVKYPDIPVVAHQGFRMYGKTEEWRAKGDTIEERIVDLRKVLANVDPKGRYTQDFEPYDERP